MPAKGEVVAPIAALVWKVMPLLFNDPAHWRERAAEARTIAGRMTDTEGRKRMLEIAKSHDKIAERALVHLSETEK